MKKPATTTALAAAIVALSLPAMAGGYGCPDCYEKVTYPPVYGTVGELHVAREGHSVETFVPPRYGVVQERVVTSPGRTVARRVPAVFGTVPTTIEVSPARREWRVSVDAYGREVGCWVDVPAVYDTIAKRVLVRPEQITYVTTPERFALVERPVVESPARVVKERIPTVYETKYRTVQVAPAHSAWEPVRAPAPLAAPGYGPDDSGY